MGIRQNWNQKDISRELNEFEFDLTSKELLALSYIGEEFVNKARIQGGYTDRTGNLRSSIGYIIAEKGTIRKKNISGKKSGGVREAKKTALKLSNDYPGELVLIVFAGMDYAYYVEAIGKDVISGSAPSESKVEKFLKQVL